MNLLDSMRNSETNKTINFHYFDNWVELAGCDKIGAAGPHAVRPAQQLLNLIAAGKVIIGIHNTLILLFVCFRIPH